MKIFKVPEHLRYRSLDELYDWLNENRDFVISSQWRVNSSAWGRWLDAREEDPHLRGTETTYEEYLRWVEARDEETIMTESDGEDGSGAARPQLARPSALPNMAYQTSYVFNDIEVVRQAGRAAERTARDTSQDRPRNCATLTSATAMSSPAAETSTRKIGSTAAIASGADPNDINRLRASAPSAENQSTDVLYNIPLLLHGSRPFARIASQSALSQLAISRTHFLRYLDYTSALEALVRESFRRRTNWVNDQAVKELTSKVVERASQLKGHKQARGVQTSACTTPQVQIIGAATGSACIEGIDPGRITTTTDIIDNLLPDSHLLRSPPPSCSPCTLSIAHLASQAIPCHFKTLYGQFLGYVDYTSSLEELVRMLFKVCPQLLEAELMRELMGRLVDTAERLEENGKEKSVQTML